MKDIFQRKTFWAMLIILLLAVFVYPPFIAKAPTGVYGQGGGEVVINRTWGWIFSSPNYSGLIMEIDFKTILAESIIAILLSIGIFLIPFRKIELMFEWVYSNLKMVLTKKAFWLMFICVSLAILIFPPFFDDKWEKREWGFILLPPTHQVVLANIKTYEAQDTHTGRIVKFHWSKDMPPTEEELEEIFAKNKTTLDEMDIFDEIKKKEDIFDAIVRQNSQKEVREMRKMKIDPIILTVELMIGFLLCILVTLITYSKHNKGQN